MTDEPREPLIDTYHAMMAEDWRGDEDEIPMGVILTGHGTLTMLALALNPGEAYEAMLSMTALEKAEEAVFALDRFAKPGQGTKYDDLLAGHYYKRGSGALPWRPFIIEYRREPRVFEPIDYNNEFWNNTLRMELRTTMMKMIKRMVPESVH